MPSALPPSFHSSLKDGYQLRWISPLTWNGIAGSRLAKSLLMLMCEIPIPAEGGREVMA